jgi:glycosyltransferase involved in cell wall biosynthesis
VPKSPLVSVLVPTYNGARYLDQTLRCISEQTHRALEIIVRDDGSTDGTLEIARSYAANDRRFQVVVSEQNGGAMHNFIEAAKLATAKFIKYCNQDDLLERTCVEKLVSPLLQDRNISLATSTRRLIDGSGGELAPQSWSLPLVEENRVLTGQSVASRMLLTGTNQIGEPTTVLFRNGLVEPDELFVYRGATFAVNGDIALWLNLLAKGNIYVHADILSSFRLHTSQRSADLKTQAEGALEWVDFLRGGLESGVIKPGAAAALAGRSVVTALSNTLTLMAKSTDNGLHPYIGRLAEAITIAWRMATAAAEGTVLPEAQVA